MFWDPVSRRINFGKKADQPFGQRVFATRISDDPIVIYAKKWALLSDGNDPAKVVVHPVVRRLAGQDVTWLVTVPWSADNDGAETGFKQAHAAITKVAPKHRVIFVANTEPEYQRFRRIGLEALHANQNQFVDPDLFHPLGKVDRPFDAIYNGRFKPYKRHELAVSIPRLSLLGYSFVGPEFDAITALFPDAHFANKFEGKFLRLSYPKVNEALNQARVGLCLSEVEGAMAAAVEYLLAGLPVVTTPSSGGRDVFFDDRFVRVAEPNPDAVARAVASFVSEDISPDFIRAETLKKLRVANQKFFDDVSQITGVPRDDLAQTVKARFNHQLAAPKNFRNLLAPKP